MSMCNVVYFEKNSTCDIMGALGILEQEDIVKFKRSQLPALFLIFVQLLNETT